MCIDLDHMVLYPYLSIISLVSFWNNTCNNRIILPTFIPPISTLHHYFIGESYPMTAQSSRFPACPMVSKSECPPLPRSSSSSWITSDRPIIDSSPSNSDTLVVQKWNALLRSCAAVMLPKSPACESILAREPCSAFVGLKCPPQLTQSLLNKLPYWCTWNPCLPGAKFAMCPDTFTAENGLSSRNVTWLPFNLFW